MPLIGRADERAFAVSPSGLAWKHDLRLLSEGIATAAARCRNG
ncbi:MAG: hypothetical protein JWQ93_3261 [Marmoricola sp.]|nr:hypothetical protein [Marmoricola sp.]